MNKIKKTAILAFLLIAVGCAGGIGNIGTRKGPVKQTRATDFPSVMVAAVQISVPESLTISEANTYKPRADIVWRGDPAGNRYEQVAAIFDRAARDATSGLKGDLPVVLHIEVRKFHSLSQKTRATIGGTHAIDFFLSVTNGATGEVMIAPYFISTNLKAFGGEAAMLAESTGQTQKVRITEHLTMLIRQELTTRPFTIAEPQGS